MATIPIDGVAANHIADGRYASAGLWLIPAVAAYLWIALGGERALVERKGRAYAGVRMVIPVSPLDPSRRASRDVINERAARGINILRSALTDARQVDLMVASGFRVIGWDRQGQKGWLFDTLLADPQQLRLRVLMLDPAGVGARQRGAQIMGPRYGAAEYRAGAEAVLSTLKDWREHHGMDVTVRLYQEDPIWQMIRLPSEMWLMSAAHFTATDLSPMYVLRRDQPYSLAWALDAVWDRRWDHPTTRSLDLETVAPPSASAVKLLTFEP